MEEQHTKPDVMESALREAALRLAWYLERYGAIPDNEVMKLQLAATLGRGKAVELLAVAEEIKNVLLEMDSSRQK